MFSSIERHNLVMDESFRGRCMIVALQYAHQILNDPDANKLLKAKAHDLVNQPESYEKRIAASVAALLGDDAACLRMYNDGAIRIAVEDMFDAMAGVGVNE